MKFNTLRAIASFAGNLIFDIILMLQDNLFTYRYILFFVYV